MTSLPEQLPEIVADGKRDAGRIMERLESKEREQGDNAECHHVLLGEQVFYDWRHCPVG